MVTANKFLRVRLGVRLTSIIEPVIVRLEPFFAEANCMAMVTSGLRLPEEQLSIIRQYLMLKKLSNQYIDAINREINDKIEWQGQQVYAWQLGWSALLNNGVIINPPMAAVCLMDYIGKDGKNRKGKIIQPSSHFTGRPFDIGGGPDGIAGSVTNELAVMQKAIRVGVKGLVSFLPERENNAIHCNCV